MGRPPQIIKQNRVKELLDGRTQIWLVGKLKKTRTPLSAFTVFKVVNNKRNLTLPEMHSLTRIFKVVVTELYAKGVDIKVLK
jgi:hypothetical protein